MEILNSLGINPGAVVWHTFNFLVLLAILHRFLYRPILRMLDQRTERIRESMAQAEAIREERQRLQEEARLLRESASQQAQQILAEAHRTAEAILAEARRRAQEETNLQLERARSEIAREREQAFQELRQQVADLAILAAGRVIGRVVNQAAHRRLVQEFLATDGDGHVARRARGR